MRSGSISRSFEPAPTKLVANLPYNVATPIVAESLDGLPGIEQLVRDGAARGRRPLLRRPVDEGVRCRLGADPARHDANRVPSRLAHRLPAAAERRLGARRVPAHAAAARLRRASGGSSREHSPTGARRSPTRSSSRGWRPASRPWRRSPSSGSTRPCAPRRSRRPSSSSWHGWCGETARGAREDQPRARRRPARRRRQARGRDRPAADLARGHRRARPRASGCACPDSPTTRSSTEALAGAGGRSPASSRLGASRSRRRSRSPPASAAAAPTRPPRSCSRTSSCRSHSPAAGSASSRRRSAPTCRSSSGSGPQLGTGDGTVLGSVDLPADYWVVLVAPASDGQDLDR